MDEKQFELAIESGIVITPSVFVEGAFSEFVHLCSAIDKEFPGSQIEYHIHGYGGDSSEAVAIANYIDMRGNVDGIVLGVANSAHSFLFAKCQRRWIGDNAYIGIHSPATVLENEYDARDLKNTLEGNVYTHDMLVAAYAGSSNISADWWASQIVLGGKTIHRLYKEVIINIGMARPYSEYRRGGKWMSNQNSKAEVKYDPMMDMSLKT